MADYPVKDGLGADIVTGYDVDDDPPVARDPSGDYPVKDGAGNTIIAAAPAIAWTAPTRPDGANIVDRYPVVDGNGNTIVPDKF